MKEARSGPGRWRVRAIPAELASRYVEQGWWDDRSLGDLVHEGLQANADQAFAVHSQSRPWRGTIGEVGRSARAFGGWLRTRGIGPGDVVVLQLPNWVEAAIAFWGATYAGAVVVPVVHFYGPKELGYILRTTEPALLVTPDVFGRIDFTQNLSSVVAELGTPWAVVSTAGDRSEGTLSFLEAVVGEPLEEPVAVDPDEPALIAFTSGTTRDPKGVIHSHRTIGFEVRQSARLTAEGGPSPITGAPVGHFIGMLSAFLMPLIRGTPVNLLDVWDPGRVLRLMVEEGVGLTGGAPYFFTSLLEHPDFTPAHLRYLPTAGMGGAPVPLPFGQRLAGLGIRVMRCYGSTEHPSITGCSFDEDEIKRLATDGHALDGVEVRLDDDGQILSRGPDLCLGYTDPQLTGAAFDAEGWYRTGDVGVLDDEGYLTITDRISDIIIRGGENISAQEIEDLLLGMPGVAEAVVVAEPHARLGERAVAVLRLSEDASPTLADVQHHLQGAGLARQKWPEAIRVVSDLPRTPSGKVQKFKLRAQIRSGVLEHER